MRKKLRLSSAQIVPLSFLAAILLGALILTLPFANASGKGDFMTSLFTSTTSVCVTGLVTVDTFSHWTAFGKIVILILIQLGGLGIVTVTSSVMMALNRKLSLSDRLLVQSSFNLSSVSGLIRFLRKVLLFSFVSEGLGAAVLYIRFAREFGLLKGLWQSVFTSVSAFCNAGLDVIGSDSLARFSDDPLVLITVMVLIVSGGLGFVVWFDISEKGGKLVKEKKLPFSAARRLGEHTRLVLFMTLTLILSGAVFVFFAEYDNPGTIGNMPFGQKVLNSLFESVTFRTAGFSTFDQGGLTQTTVILGCILMFIGGSPVGTAGGIKTAVFAIVVANALSFIRNKNETTLKKRRVSDFVIRKSNAIFTVSLFAAITCLLLLTAFEDLDLCDSVFEVFSAVGTVGLSRGVTPNLGTAGKIIIMTGMFLGRIGPISMAIFFNSNNNSKNRVKNAEGTFFAG